MHRIVAKIHSRYIEFLRVKNFVSSSASFSSAGETKTSELKGVSTHQTLSQKHDIKEVETIWYNWWESQNYFKATKPENESFVLLLPPPNITGTLHLGHVLTATIQDIIVRWRRMKGESVIWIPGIDHAGIATQVAVEKHLMQNLGVSRYDLGREEFVKRVWDWKHEKENKIYQQLRNIGASLDWERVKFTLDPVHSDLVAKSFIKLYNKGLIYRKKSLVNWSCALKSSISDIEIEWKNIDKVTKLKVPGHEKPVEFGKMYKIAYKVCDEDDEIIVHTTRPETFPGDVAIAVHPDDPKYAKYINKMVWHPFRCEKIPVVADDFVTPDLGSGAVKITPAHNLEDFEVGQRHNLTKVNVFDENGVVMNVGKNDKFFGMKRYEARDVIIDELAKLNLFRGDYEHSTTIPLCSRSGDVVENLLKSQWFLNVEPLAADAIHLVNSGKLKLVPDNYNNVWLNWLNNAKDWNLSRQLWWGHQIPMYKCKANDKEIWVPALNLGEAQVKASESLKAPKERIEIIHDPDVLDTWFSSGLLPLSTLNDSDKPPISLMVTGHDILFFWVARMIFLTRSLTGKLPFDEVILHGLICDSKGRKMSKSLGNVIRPEDVVNGRSLDEMNEDLEKSFKIGSITRTEVQSGKDALRKMFPQGIPPCGIDALRFSLCSTSFQSGFVNFDIKLCHASKEFCNKVWQATKYFQKMLDDCKSVGAGDPLIDFRYDELEKEKLKTLDKWILSRMASVVEVVDKSLNTYWFSGATKSIKLFVTDDFCATYLECSKSFLRNDSSEYKKIILIFLKCIETYLKLLSPFMPFVTEHLYQALPPFKGFNKSESIMIAPFPVYEDWKMYRNVELEDDIQDLMKILTSVRGVLDTYSLTGTKPLVYLKCPKSLGKIILEEESVGLATLGKVGRFLPHEGHDGINVIERSISEDIVAYVEHKASIVSSVFQHTKETLENLLGPTIEKEREVKESMENLNAKMEKESKKKKKTPSEVFKFQKQMNNLEKTLTKIQEFKKVIENCNR